MITRCARCGERIRDCTGHAYIGFALVSVPAWYHTDTGLELCAGGAAWPVLNVSVRCPGHPDHPDDDCPACETSSQVSLFFHNDGRCVEKLCRWPHA